MMLTPKNSLVPGGDVYTVDEVAQAAGVPAARVQALVAAGQIAPEAHGFIGQEQALAAVRSLRADGGRAAAMLFDHPEFVHASARLPIAVSSAFHAGIAAS